MAGLPNKLDGRELTKPKNNTKNKKPNSSENYSNISSVKNSNYESNNKRSIHSTKDIFSQQLNNNNNNTDYNITRKNNNRKDSSYPFREQSRISNRIDSNNSSNFTDISSSAHRKSSYNSSHKSINTNNLELLSKSTSSRLISINSSSNMKIYEKSKYDGISSVSRGHSPISIDEINFRSIDKMNLNEKYSRSNLNNNNYSQIDNQSYSNQYYNKDLSKSNNNYSINKCENCQNLILQNDDAQSEIRKLKWDIDKLNNQYKLENEQLEFEIKYLKSNNENKKLEKQINNLESENKFLNTFKIENENLKLEINKNKSEKEKLRKEIDYLKSTNENSRVQFDNLENSNKQLLEKYENMNSKNIESGHLIKYLQNENLRKAVDILETENKKYKINIENLKEKYESEIDINKLENVKLKSEIEYLKSNKENYLDNSNNQLLDKYENMKWQINKYESEIENMKFEIIKLDQHNKDLRNENKKLIKQVKDFTSSKFEPMIHENKENSERSDGNLNQSLPPIKPALLDNANTTPSKSNSRNQSTPNIKSSNLKEKLKPIGFDNPKGFCFLNCIVQQFYSCQDFRNALINYHKTSEIADYNLNEKSLFVNYFCKLMDEISNRNEMKIKEMVMNIQEFFKDSSFGDDVYKCFMNILTAVSNVTNKQENIKKSASMPSTPRHSFDIYRNQHQGFVFDLFYGQMAIKLVCSKCAFEFNKRFQLFKSIPLPVPKSTEMIPLENVIKNYLEASPVDTNDIMDCRCPGGSKNLYSITEFTHMPSYIFIYLNRGSYFDNVQKNNTFINCNEILTFPTGESSTKYRLISVIDHIGDKYGGHYYAKSCFETDQWWILNDSFVNLIEDKKSIITKQAIVFLFKKFSQ